MNVPALIREAAPIHDLAWWAAEAERGATDWRGILLTVLRSLNVVAPCNVCEREPCLTPSFCQLAREADAKQNKYRENKAALSVMSRTRPTPRPTIEAIKQSVRDGGLADLKNPATRDRLARCEDEARAEIDRWLTRFKEGSR
jgi:hypothetical protein